MSPEVFSQILEIIIRHTPDKERLRLADQLTKSATSKNQPRLVRRYRKTWYGLESDRAAARAISAD